MKERNRSMIKNIMDWMAHLRNVASQRRVVDVRASSEDAAEYNYTPNIPVMPKQVLNFSKMPVSIFI